MVSWRWRPKSISKAPTPVESETPATKSTIDDHQHQFRRDSVDSEHPDRQNALLLHAIRQPYEIANDHAVPEIQNDTELLVKVTAAGLNPIDWKSP